MFQGKVFVTGGAGYLARAIYRKAAREAWPCTFTCFSRDQAKHVLLRDQYPDVRCIQGDVAGDRDFLAAAMTGHDLVIHAAALKYVDLSEFHARDAIRVNLDGSLNVIHAALTAGVAQCIGISTDKACAPVSVYGMTKALMERAFGEASTRSTWFKTCRYGNVVGSTGSVIPLFRKQLAQDGRVKITNPAMTRFWMPVDEAVDLITLTAERAQPGWTVIPYPAAMRIDDVARAATRDDVEIEIIGERPGEKADEQLVHHQESVRAKRFDTWIALVPPDKKVEGDQEAFTIASHSPSRLLSVETMRSWIADAELV